MAWWWCVGEGDSNGSVMSIGVCERWFLVCSVDVGGDGVSVNEHCCGVVVEMVVKVGDGRVGVVDNVAV